MVFFTVTILNYRTLLYLFSNKMLVIRAATLKVLAAIYKIFVGKANSADPGQTACEEAI